MPNAAILGYLKPFLEDIDNNPEAVVVLRLIIGREDNVRRIAFSNLNDEEKVTQIQALFLAKGDGQ